MAREPTNVVRSILEPLGRSVRVAWIAFSIASSFFLYEFLTRVEPSLAAADITHYFGLSDAGFGTLSSVFFWVYAPMQIVVGLLLDRYGARHLVLLGSLVCATGVFVLTATHVPVVGALGRAFTGFGASFAFVSALWLVNHWFPPERFALLSGGVNAVGMLGTAAGTVVLSSFIAAAGWRTVFYVTAVVGLLIFVVALALLREPHSPAATATSTPGEHVRQSLADVIGNRRTWMIAIIGLLFYMPINVYGGLWGTTELVEERHLSQTAAETTVSMIFWGMAAGSVLGGWVSDRLGHRKYLVFTGAMLSGVAYVGVLFLPSTAW
jgi:MFS family permease